MGMTIAEKIIALAAGVPYTDSEEFVGCEAWLLREDPVEKAFKLYVERPEGGYLECR